MFRFWLTNPWWAHIIDNNGKVSKAFDSYDNSVRSQDLPKLYSISGAIWIAKIDEFMKEKTFMAQITNSKNKLENAIDIDEYEDLELAKNLNNLKYKVLKNNFLKLINFQLSPLEWRICF